MSAVRYLDAPIPARPLAKKKVKAAVYTILEELVLEDEELQELRETGRFDDLPVDPYTTGGYRSRRFARVQLDGASLRPVADQRFSQGTEVNRYLGGVVREYERVGDDFLSADVVHSICGRLADRAELPDGTFGIHQIRISCSPGHEGSPAPEGIHRDGVRFLFICCVDRVDVAGGRTQLFELSPRADSGRNGTPFFDEVLPEGACLLVNDGRLAHYTSPISPTAQTGYRDALVVTIE